MSRLQWGTARSSHGGTVRRFVHWMGNVVGQSVYHADLRCWTFVPSPAFSHVFSDQAIESRRWETRSGMAVELTDALEAATAR